MRTLDEALEKFTLVQGTAGSESEKTACETSLLNWIWDGPDFIWGDDLACASPLIRSLMISHSDSTSTTQEQRVEAVTLGMEGALDTWWIPAEVILSYYGDFTREETPTHHERLVKMLKGVAAWKLDKVSRNLDGANLNGANLVGANLYRASLVGANLNGANLYGASLNVANLNGAGLDGASLDGASLYGANLNGASLDGASLDGANLNGASLDGASLYGANLYRASLVRAILVGANLNGASLYGASLVRAILVGANLNGANLDGASLYGANLNRANLDGASLDGANLDGASLDGANLNGANLDGANLDGASLDGASLDGANLDGASLDGASLDGASLYGVLYLGSARNLDKATGEPASLPDGWKFKNGLIQENLKCPRTHDEPLYRALGSGGFLEMPIDFCPACGVQLDDNAPFRAPEPPSAPEPELTPIMKESMRLMDEVMTLLVHYLSQSVLDSAQGDG
jgi:uncharacterized protein YjbI with pentapeptide repeats